MSHCASHSLPCDQPPRGAGGNAGVSTHERLMDHQPASEDPGSRLETRRPVETTAVMVGSGNCRPMTHLKQNIGQCPSGKRTSARCCVPGVGSRRGGRAPDVGRLPILGLGLVHHTLHHSPLYITHHFTSLTTLHHSPLYITHPFSSLTTLQYSPLCITLCINHPFSSLTTLQYSPLCITLCITHHCTSLTTSQRSTQNCWMSSNVEHLLFLLLPKVTLFIAIYSHTRPSISLAI